MGEPVLLVEKSEGIATVTLNRPGAANALSMELRAALAETFDELNEDAETKAAILTGAGKAFCGGLDLKELMEKGIQAIDPEKIKLGADFFINRTGFKKPIIGAINGAAITGGFELALASDILIASTRAVFADTHARVGFIPGAGLSQALSRIIGLGRAKELSLTGNFLSAAQAERWGLVNRVVQPEELLPACRALAKDILSCPTEIIEKYRNLIDDGYDLSYADAMELEAKVFLEHASRISGKGIASQRDSVMERGREQKKRQ